MGTCKVRNEIETKRNETDRNETKRNQTKRNEEYEKRKVILKAKFSSSITFGGKNRV
jgi:hypothetical protein